MEENDEILIEDIGDTPDPSLKSKKIKRIILLIFILILIAGIILVILYFLKASDNNNSSIEKFKVILSDSQINKPLHTNKKYEIIQLTKSKYKFILVHDPKALNGGIEIRTKFGFNTDLIDGFAHYAEHVFLGGTENISEADIFNLVIPFNEVLDAYTYYEETVFQNFGSNYTFETLLQYISDFIQKPKLNQTFLKTEINVVTSEFDFLNSTDQIFLEILSQYSNPEHGFYQTISRHIGNNDTLGNYSSDYLAKELKNYYRIIFNPENCAFLLYSSKSLEELREYALNFFDFKLEEPDKDYSERFNEKIASLDKEIFNEGQLGKIAYFNSMRETPIIIFSFLISQEVYVQSTKILEFLFYDTKNNSLLKYLNDENYISRFEINSEIYFKKNELVTFLFDLTEKGCAHIDEIIKAVFASINSIKKDDNIESVINNLKVIEEIKFKNLEDEKPELPDDIDSILINDYYFKEENILGSPDDTLYSLDRVKKILSNLTPNNSFIFIDSNNEIKSKYFENEDILYKYTRAYNVPYKVYNFSTEDFKELDKINNIGDYVFKLRDINDDYTRLIELTEKPCYEKTPVDCKYNEYDPNNETDLYVLQNTSEILSLMKIDRSYGIPFIKGFVKISFDEESFNEYISDNDSLAIFYLIVFSLKYKFEISDLSEAGTEIEISENLDTYFGIKFSTYNDLLDKVIELIINALNEPVNESTFNLLKEIYYLRKAKNKEDPLEELNAESLNTFKKFISANTYIFDDISEESIVFSSYDDFKYEFNLIKNIIIKVTYLSYGDISLKLAEDSTEKLSQLINEKKIHLKESAEKDIEIPENTSLLFSYVSKDIYEKQGVTYVMFEFDEEIMEEMTIYSYCASIFIFDYLRVKRGLGYMVRTNIENVLGKNYLSIFSLGSVYSPERMDRFINEAIKESFSYDKCQVDLIRKHLKNVKDLKYSAQRQFEDLIVKFSENIEPETFNNENNEKNLTYQDIIEKVQDVFVNKPKRICILYHKGNISDDELENQNNELDTYYYLNQNIVNIITNDITYLENITNIINN